MPRPHHRPRPRAGLLLLAAAVIAAALAVGSASAASTASLQDRIAASRAHERSLQSSLAGEDQRIAGYQGRIDDLRARLAAVENSLEVQRALLLRIETRLRAARARLAVLRARLATDKRVLAAQLVADYKAPTPDLTTVVLEAHGFTDLLERVGHLKTIARRNADITAAVDAHRRAVADEAARLAVLASRQRRVTAAVLVERDQVAQLKLAVVSQQLVVIRARDRTAGALDGLRARRSALEHELAAAQARAAAALAQPAIDAPGAGLGTGGAPPFASHGGDSGFFQAAGTNYSVGSEPAIAARLDALGKALGLHLIGISGYRSPAHSVEVGGFANDPHTRGEASDTPGVEGVSEATLNRFGLTRPFGGAAEADHVQLVGSAG